MSDLYTPQSAISPNTIARSSSLNNLSAAVTAAFNKMPNEAEIKNRTINYVTGTGTAQAHVVTLPYVPTAYADGMEICFRPAVSNAAGTTTINVNGLGVKEIRRYGSSALPVASDLRANVPVTLRYGSSQGFFYIQNAVSDDSKMPLTGGTFIGPLPVYYGGKNLDVSSASYGNAALNKTTSGSQNTAFGNNTLVECTTGAANTAIGANAIGLGGGAAFTGSYNAAVGAFALNALKSGSYNVVFGAVALSNNVSGSQNIAIGTGALEFSTGSNNVAMGHSAARNLLGGTGVTAIGYLALTAATGNDNTACGSNALLNETTGSGNTAFGANAMMSQVAGGTDGNTAFGFNALLTNTGSIYNAAFGFEALKLQDFGGTCSAFGAQALKNSVSGAYNNTAVGGRSLLNLSTGNSNAALGGVTGFSLVTGVQNTLIGESTDVNDANATNRTVLGYDATGTLDNQVTLGNASVTEVKTTGRIKLQGDIIAGLGASAVATNTAFGASALNANTTGQYSVGIGYNALQAQTTVGFNTAVGGDALKNASTGQANVGIGYQSGNILIGASSFNTMVGMTAGGNFNTGSNNTFVGYAAGYGNDNVTNNTAVGYNSTVAAGTTNATALGNGAATTVDNQIVLGNTAITEVKTSGKVSAGMGTGTGVATLIGAANVNVTAVGNVGAGTDDLMTYSLPANSLSANTKGIRITAWGGIVNNVNAKTVTINFGSTVMATIVVPINAAAYWSATATVVRSGASAQKFIADLNVANSAAGTTVINRLSSSSAQTDTAAITIKCTGTAVSNNDITQDGMLIEFIS